MLLHTKASFFSNEIKKLLLAEKSLKQQEDILIEKLDYQKKLSFNPELDELPQVSFECFLPDHLEFGCKTGFLLFRASHPPLQSYLMFRN